MVEIHIADIKSFDEKKKHFIDDGIEQLHLILDYDGTITCAFSKDKSVGSAYSYLRQGTYMPKAFQEGSKQLFLEYHPIEMDPKLSLDVKRDKIHEWFSKHYQLMVKYGATKDLPNRISDDMDPHFREGAVEIFEFAHKRNIPLLVLSAGWGDLIDAFLQKSNLFTKNVQVISNYLTYDADDKANGYTLPMITSCTKNEANIASLLPKEVHTRKNVIVIGDHLGDADMAEGVLHNCVLKIGLLNKDVDELLPHYMEAFDVVITHDGPMDFVLEILNQIAGA